MGRGFEDISKAQLIIQWLKDEMLQPKKQINFDLKIINNPNLGDEEENKLRFCVLSNLNGAIGDNYYNIDNCKRGFINPSQFKNLQILHDGKNEDDILKATNGTRKIRDLINSVNKNHASVNSIKIMYNPKFFIEYLIENRCPKRLFVCKNISRYTIVDGNHRAIAMSFNEYKSKEIFPIEVYLFSGPF